MGEETSRPRWEESEATGAIVTRGRGREGRFSASWAGRTVPQREEKGETFERGKKVVSVQDGAEDINN